MQKNFKQLLLQTLIFGIAVILILIPDQFLGVLTVTGINSTKDTISQTFSFFMPGNLTFSTFISGFLYSYFVLIIFALLFFILDANINVRKEQKYYLLGLVGLINVINIVFSILIFINYTTFDYQKNHLSILPFISIAFSYLSFISYWYLVFKSINIKPKNIEKQTLY